MPIGDLQVARFMARQLVPALADFLAVGRLFINCSHDDCPSRAGASEQPSHPPVETNRLCMLVSMGAGPPNRPCWRLPTPAVHHANLAVAAKGIPHGMRFTADGLSQARRALGPPHDPAY